MLQQWEEMAVDLRMDFSVTDRAGHRLDVWPTYDLAWISAELHVLHSGFDVLFVRLYNEDTGESGLIISAAGPQNKRSIA